MSGRVQTLESNPVITGYPFRPVVPSEARLQNLYAGSGKEKIIDAVFEHFQYDLEEAWLSFFLRRLLKGTFKWKRRKVMEKTWRKQSKLSWFVSKRSFVKFSPGHFPRWEHRLSWFMWFILFGRSMPDGGLKASPSLRNSSMSVGHSEAIFHMESQCHVLLLETV